MRSDDLMAKGVFVGAKKFKDQIPWPMLLA